MGITYTTLSDGDAMTVATMATEFNKGITWLRRGIVAGDIDAASILPVHLYRPDHYEYPLHGSFGCLEDIYDRHSGNNSLPTYVGIPAGLSELTTTTGIRGLPGASPDQLSIFMKMLPAGNRFVLGWTAVRLELYEPTSWVDYTVTWRAFTKYAWTNDEVTYPTSAGHFIVAYRRVDDSSGVRTTVDYSQRDIYANMTRTQTAGNYPKLVEDDQDIYANVGNTQFSTGIYKSFTQGVWDIWLQYELPAAPSSDLNQIITHARNVTVEVHPVEL